MKPAAPHSHSSQSSSQDGSPYLPPLRWQETAFVLLCGGQSQRIRVATADKVLFPLAGHPVFFHSLRVWREAAPEAPVVIVYRDDAQKSAIQKVLQPHTTLSHTLYWAQGGETRQHSVLSGLAALPDNIRYLFIHDAARPLLTAETVQRIAKLLPTTGAVTCARPVTDTIHFAKEEAHGEQPVHWETLDRTRLWSMETPQAFAREILEQAHSQAQQESLSLTDDASALIHSQIPVTPLVPSHPNFKLTRPEDIPLMESLMNQSSPVIPDLRIGQGFDIHRFAEGRKLILGGVEIPHSRGLEGHSDADCLCHALADAILGACGLPDIGHFFPNNDPSIEGIDSLLIVQRAVEEVAARGWQLVNCDISVLAEQPKIGPHLAAMKAKLAEVTKLTTDRIGIKATTLEKIGGLGRAEGIACMANVLLAKPGN